ncbi:MAG: thioredoxin domain-containing protein [Succinatimonas sp.]|nr:thioredoxin domain-containing protein [Succinatimonas sp.]
MHKFKIMAMSLLLGIATTTQAFEFDAEQKAAIESIVNDYVSNHPEIIIKAMQKLEAQEQERHIGKVRLIGESFRSKVEAPSLGDAQRKHYIIDFYDYNCGYCKTMEPMLLKAYEELDCQVVFVDLPVITPQSRQIGVVAQALFNLNPEHFFAFHKIFMERYDKESSLEFIEEQVKKIGASWDKVMEEMKSGRPQQQLNEFMRVSQELGVRGTPYLIIDGKEVRGAIQNYDDLKALLK